MVVPVTVLGLAMAAVCTVGDLDTLTWRCPRVPLLAVTVALLTDVLGAVSRPLVLIVPAVVVHVKRRLRGSRHRQTGPSPSR